MKKLLKKNYICLILARKGSKRIKNKNLIKINKKPLINYTLDSIIPLLPNNNIYLSTNDERIAKIAKKNNIQFIKRPENLCRAESTSEEGIIHALRLIKKDKEFDNVIFLQPTSPLRKKEDILACVKKYEEDKLDSIFSVYKAKKFIWTYKDKLSSLTFNYKKRQRSQNLRSLIIENGAIFIFNAKKFLKFKNRIFGKFDFFEMREQNSFDIDTLEDLELVKQILKK